MKLETPHGRVTVNDLPTKNKLYRFCEKKIDQWVKTHWAPSDERPFEFQVSFTDEGDAHQVSCVTEIQLAGAVYRGCDLACDTQQALMHSLKRLQPH